MDNILTSRFIQKEDDYFSELIYKIPNHWWSRPFEYSWSSKFINKKDVVLDAGCGIPHHFKFYLTTVCDKVYACDYQDRIRSNYYIKESIKWELGTEEGDRAIDKLESLGCFEKGEFLYADITKLPFQESKFDKIFCISLLEEMGIVNIILALREFKRVLKDDGIIILTFDYPIINFDHLDFAMNLEGLEYAGDVDMNLKGNEIYSNIWDLKCFRAVLRKKREKV